MKGRTLAILLLVTLSGSFLFITRVARGTAAAADRQLGSAGQRPGGAERLAEELDGAPTGSRQIDGSTVNAVSPNQVITGIWFDLCFNVTVFSPDSEYMDRFDVDLPDAWSVGTVYPVAKSSLCEGATTEGVEAGSVVYWQIDRELPSACGAWLNGTYDFCAAIWVPGCTGEPWSLPWDILGDGFGATQHQASGTAGPVVCQLPGLYLAPNLISVSACHSVTQTHTLNLLNYTGADGTLNLTYDVPSGLGTLSGPDGIYLGNGVDQDFEVELTPKACLAPGRQFTGTVQARGFGYSDASLVEVTIIHQPGCPECLHIYLPLVLRNLR